METTCELLSLASLEAAAECLKVMAHPVRLRIVDILMQAALPVHEIAALCDLPPHQTCEHLRLLKGHGIARKRTPRPGGLLQDRQSPAAHALAVHPRHLRRNGLQVVNVIV